MKEVARSFIKSPRIIILLVTVLLSIIMIGPTFDGDGAAIRTVIANSSAQLAGMTSPSFDVRPTDREVIISINNEQVKTAEDYERIISGIKASGQALIRTDRGLYTIEVPESLDVGLRVYERPTTNIRKGLDISGGTRVLLRPVVPENESPDYTAFEIIKDNIEQRLNIYGLSDLSLRIIYDQPAVLGGKPTYISAEISGFDDTELSSLISSQGKFEAVIANKTVFEGGERDITYICKTAECSGIDPFTPCQAGAEGGYICRFRFSISISPDAAQRFADATRDLQTITGPDNSDPYLSENIIFYLDNAETDSLTIDSSLKGQAATDIQISGSGAGATRDDAQKDALMQMKEMQSVLSTGSLPYELEIVSTQLVSAKLGTEFLKNALYVGLVAILCVAFIIYVRYRVISVVIPVIIAMVSELVLLLGMASLIGWTIDLAAIAGIIVAIGTGVDDQIVITDEIIKGRRNQEGYGQRIKKAFFIIFCAYATTLVAMTPLLFAGAGLLKGFAITTMLGVSFGVFITRPAYARMLQLFMEKE